jgi:hypothetical protein
MSIQNGDVVILQIGGVQIGALVSNSQNMSADMLDKTNKDTPGIKQYDAGEDGWTLSVEALWDPAATEGFSEALGYLKAGTEITVTHGITGTSVQQGTGLIASIDVAGPKNEIASYSLEIQGTGEFSTGLGPELLTNWDFSAWTGDDPDGWTVTGESGVDPMVTEVATNKCRIYSSSANVQISQSGVMTIGLQYRMTVVVDAADAGAFKFGDGSGTQSTISTPGTHNLNFTAAGITALIRRSTGGGDDMTFISASLKQLL